VHAAFAHRRKPLANSLAHSYREDRGIRERAAAALAEIGLDANTRAEQLTAEQFVLLQTALGPSA
jgi:16S rRNA A1518/A1519 N6-dimethyltransferase RsmA/KsgA/DIM1 with predicted DNA glycosylase/AP lyase activity